MSDRIALRPTGRLAGCLVVAALVLLSPEAFAARPWGKARPLGFEPQAAAIDERGFAIAVGERRGRLVAARRTPRRSFGEHFAVAPDAIPEPAIAFDDRTASILFQRKNRGVETRRVGSDGARTPRRLLSAEDDGRFAQRLSLSQLTDGPQLAWWTRGPHEYYADPALQIAGAGPAGLLPARTYDYTLIPPVVAVEPDGRPLVAFADYIEGTSYPATGAAAITHAADDRSLSPSQYVGQRPEIIYDFALDVAPDGAAILAWDRRVDGGGEEVLVSRRPPGGSFTPPEVLSRHERAVEQLTVAFTADGDPLVGWLAREEDDCYFCSRLMLAEPGGERPVRLASGVGERVQRFALAVDGTGGATLAWTTNPRHRGDGLVTARAVTRTGRLGKIHRLNDGYARSHSIALAVGSRGDALIAWTKENGTSRAVRRPAGG